MAASLFALRKFSPSFRSFWSPPGGNSTKIKAPCAGFQIGYDRRHMSASLPSQVPVLIVGGGPVGLVLSILLAKLGIQCLVIDKKPHFSQHPQAHFINNRTMEIFKKLDGLAEQIEALQPPLEQWRKFIYCTTLSGSVLGIVDHLQPQDLSHIKSPTWVAHFSQHRLLPLLLERAERLGFVSPETGKDSIQHPGVGQIRLGHECISIEATSEGAVVEVSVYGKDPEKVTCKYLIGADGAASSVRRLIGANMDGDQEMQNLISIHFFSKELGQYLDENRPGMLYFVFNPKAIGVVVAHDLRLGEFVVQLPFYPPQQSVEDFTTKVCKEIIWDLAGYDSLDIEVKAVKQWTMHAQVVEKYIFHDGHVILAGDAAHRFPPAGGFGMNTGIQDVHNLAWKLAAVLNSIAPPALLSTYEEERRPIAQENTTLSISNYRAAMSIPSVLGLDPSAARLIHQTINSSIGSIIPPKLQTTVLKGIFALGRAQLSSLFLNRYNPLGSIRLEKVGKILEGGQSLQLQFPAEDLGFRSTSPLSIFLCTGPLHATCHYFKL